MSAASAASSTSTSTAAAATAPTTAAAAAAANNPKRPVALRCNHIFCHACLTEYFKPKKDAAAVAADSKTCPICRQPVDGADFVGVGVGVGVGVDCMRVIIGVCVCFIDIAL
jgi:hypothetical protein